MKDIATYDHIRKVNVIAILREKFENRQILMAQALGVSQQLISTWVKTGENAKPLGERATRKIELKLGLKRYSLDSENFIKDQGFTEVDIKTEPRRPTNNISFGDVVEFTTGGIFLCTDVGSRFFMAVNLNDHFLGDIKNPDRLFEIEEKFLHESAPEFKTIGKIELNLS